MELYHEVHTYKGFPLLVIKANNLEFRPHWHSDVEMLYVLSGSVLVSINKTRTTIGSGGFAVFGSRDIHHFEKCGGRSVAIIIIFKPELVGDYAGWPLSGRLAGNVLMKNEHPAFSRKAEALALSLLAETSERRPGFANAARGCLLQLCGLVERELGPGTAPPADPRPAGSLAERMQSAIDYIHDKADYPIMLEDVAKVASLSPCYFSRAFKRTVGSSFSRFVNEVRIERAERLMASTAKTLADIALECGFESLRTFNRAFRAIRGTPPSAARAGLPA